MTGKKRLVWLIAISTVASLVIVGVSITLLYQSAFEQQRLRLIDSVRSQAALIGAVARHDEKIAPWIIDEDPDHDATESTLGQIRDAHKDCDVIGETGEFTLARLEGDQIVFLLSHRHLDFDNPHPVPIDARDAEPMRRALRGESGSLVGLDYRGAKVLAAHEFVPELGIGLVAKIDVSEIQAPFVRTGLISLAIAFVFIGISAVLFIRIGNPVVTELLEKEARLKANNTRLEALWSVNSLAETDLGSLSEHILKTICRMTGSEYGFYGLVSDDESEMFVHAWSGDAMKDCSMASRPTAFRVDSSGVWAEAIRKREPLVLNDYEASHPAKKGLPEGHVNLTRLLVVPHFSSGKITAIAGVSNRDIAYDQEDINQVSTFLSAVQSIVDRRSAEERIQFLSQVTEQVTDSIITTDLEFRITYVNKAFCNLFGYHRDEVVGKTPDMLNAEPNAPEIQDEIYRLMAAGKIWCGEVANRRKDGTLFDCELTIYPVENREGEVIAYAGSQRDVTERNEAAEKLVLSENKYRTIIEGAQDGVTVFDHKGRIIETNDAFCDMLGYNRDQLVGMTWQDIDAQETEQETKPHIEELSQAGRDRFETRHRRHDGAIIDVEVSVRRFGDNPSLFVNFIRDITERKQAVKKLAESEERHRRLFDQSNDAIFVCDSLSIVDVNKRACELTGYNREELLQMSVLELHPEKERQRLLTLKRGAEPEGSIRFQSQYETATGEILEVEISTKILESGSSMVQSIVRDVTETKRLQELESRAQRLETAGIIAGQVAHDFNNLLAPLMAYPEFIREELPAGHSVLSLVDQIEEASHKIAEINQDLLAMGRRGHFTQDVLNLNTVVHEVIAENKGCPSTLYCDYDLASDLMPVLGGGSQLHRMISNLVNNARDAMTDIGRLTIRTENYYRDLDSIDYAQIPKGEYVRLTITDTGCGIPEDMVNKIFDPFFTTKQADKKRGSGLGMSVVDAVVKDHRGFIDLQTQVGKGTSFFVYLPITRMTPEREVPEEIEGGPERLLIVDDDHIQREVTSQILSRLEYTIDSVSSGEEAVEYLKHDRYDLVILDMVMPGGIDGADTYRQLLQINPDQRAIILSGFSESDRVIEAQKLGAGDFIKKPITSRVIASAVRKELDREGSRAQPAGTE